MDFHEAFYEIDTDHSGEITREELIEYMHKKNYKETFVTKWLSLFDVDDSGTITYEEYCETLGLVPKQPEKKLEPEPMEVSEAPVARTVGAKAQSTPAAEETITRSVGAKAKSTPTPAPASKPVPPSRGAGNKDGKGAGRSAPRNTPISKKCGVLMRFSRARVMQKKALYRYKPATARGSGSGKKATGNAEKSPKTVTKEVNGDNNGSSRTVPINRSPRSYPSQEKRRTIKGNIRKREGRKQVARLRPSIQPGTILILLTGRHRGKRVVFLKQLESSGMLLVTGPLKLNGCPLRRVHQTHVIATSTRIDVSGVDLPERVTDAYFRRARKDARDRKGDGDIFKKDSEKYELTAERREDQRAVDGGVLAAIKSSEEGPMLRGYLRQLFGLKRGEFPHSMRF